MSNSALSDYTSLSPLIVAQLWDKALQDGVGQKEFLSKFQGAESSMMPIIEKQDLNKGGADTINFTVGSKLVGDGVQGASTLIGNEEKLKLYTYQCPIDWRRHAVATDRRLDSFTAAQRKMALTEMVAEWCAYKKQIDALLMYRRYGAHSTSGIANNLFYSGGGSTDADLTADNQLDTALFHDARQKLTTLGAKPVAMDAEGQYRRFIMWATTDALAGLQNDSAWINAQQQARPREGGADKQNFLFTGSFAGKEYNGIVPFEVPVADHDNPESGAIGSPLQPRALLRTALSDSTTTTINGGGSSGAGTSILYFRDFPGYDYLFTAGQTADTTSNNYSGTHYIKIKNVAGSTDAGKFEICSYTGSNNNGNRILVTRNVSGTTSTNHDANSIIVPCNANGVEIGYVVFTGAWSMLRAYGVTRERITSDTQDYQFVNGVGVEAVYGQALAQRRDGKYPNFVIAKVALG